MKLTTTEMTTYIASMNNTELDTYAVTLRNAITLGADVDLCNFGIKAIMRERFSRTTRCADIAARFVRDNEQAYVDSDDKLAMVLVWLEATIDESINHEEAQVIDGYVWSLTHLAHHKA